MLAYLILKNRNDIVTNTQKFYQSTQAHHESNKTYGTILLMMTQDPYRRHKLIDQWAVLLRCYPIYNYISSTKLGTVVIFVWYKNSNVSKFIGAVSLIIGMVTRE